MLKMERLADALYNDLMIAQRKEIAMECAAGRPESCLFFLDIGQRNALRVLVTANSLAEISAYFSD